MVQGDRGGIRDVEAGDRAARRQTRQQVAGLARQAAQPGALGAQHQSDRAARIGLGQAAVGGAVEADAPEPGRLQPLERPAQVAGLQVGQVLEGPGGRLGQNAGFGGGVVARRDHRRGAERGGRTQDGADIVRVGHLVEQNHHRAPPGRAEGPLDGLLQPRLGQRLGQQGDALVHRTRRQEPGQLVAAHRLDGRPVRRAGGTQALGQRGLGLAGRQEAPAAARRIGQSRGHRVESVEP